MAIRYPTATRNTCLDAAVDLLDAGPGAGTIAIRTGTQPASANTAPTGTLLATFTLNDPAFAGAVAGAVAASTSPTVSTTSVASGDAGWFRASDSTGATVFDGSVTATGGGGDLTLNTIAITSGLTLTLTGGTLTHPAG
jgi:hypothetical protein